MYSKSLLFCLKNKTGSIGFRGKRIKAQQERYKERSRCKQIILDTTIARSGASWIVRSHGFEVALDATKVGSGTNVTDLTLLSI